MPLLGPFDRPLRFGVASGTGRARRRAGVPAASFEPAVGGSVGSERTAALARDAARVLLGDVEHVGTSSDDLHAIFHDDVVVWSPSFYRCGRRELIDALSDRDDALGQIEVHTGLQLADDAHACTEWHLTGSFDRAAFVGDDVLVEPSHRVVEAAGVLICAFDDGRIRAVRCYVDELGVIERLLLDE